MISVYIPGCNAKDKIMRTHHLQAFHHFTKLRDLGFKFY